MHNLCCDDYHRCVARVMKILLDEGMNDWNGFKLYFFLSLWRSFADYRRAGHSA